MRFKNIGYTEGIDHGSQHAHVITGYTLNAMPGNLGATDEVAAANHNHHLSTSRRNLLDLFGQPANQFGVDAVLKFTS